MELLKRKNIRLNGYDYSKNGAYYITICTDSRKKILSQIRSGDPCGRQQSGRPYIELTQLGIIAQNTFSKIEKTYDIIIDTYIIMPDHIHFIIFNFSKTDTISIQDKATARVAPTVGQIVGGYKSIIANEWLKLLKQIDKTMGKIWRRNYYEHVIRNEEELYEIRKYIIENPMNPEIDDEIEMHKSIDHTI